MIFPEFDKVLWNDKVIEPKNEMKYVHSVLYKPRGIVNECIPNRPHSLYPYLESNLTIKT